LTPKQEKIGIMPKMIISVKNLKKSNSLVSG